MCLIWFVFIIYMAAGAVTSATLPPVWLLLGSNGRNQISNVTRQNVAMVVVLNIHTQLNTEKKSTGCAWKSGRHSLSTHASHRQQSYEGGRGSLVSPNTNWIGKKEKKRRFLYSALENKERSIAAAVLCMYIYATRCYDSRINSRVYIITPATVVVVVVRRSL